MVQEWVQMMKRKIQLSDHFDYPTLLRFTVPSILMMVISSVYSIVDGLFISNFAGSDGFAAVNLMMPIAMLVSCVGFMAGAGGSALVSKTFGEQQEDAARHDKCRICLPYRFGIFHGAPGERTFYRVKVPNAPGSGKR